MNVLHLHENMGLILQLAPEILFDVNGMLPALNQPSSDHPLQPPGPRETGKPLLESGKVYTACTDQNSSLNIVQ